MGQGKYIYFGKKYITFKYFLSICQRALAKHLVYVLL